MPAGPAPEPSSGSARGKEEKRHVRRVSGRLWGVLCQVQSSLHPILMSGEAGLHLHSAHDCPAWLGVLRISSWPPNPPCTWHTARVPQPA